MNLEDIKFLESAFNVSLPENYKEVLLKNPLSLEFPEEEVDPLIMDWNELMETNQLWRDKGYYGRSWPENAFWIGSDGGGGAYFIICDGSEAVYYIDWEDRSAKFENLSSLKKANTVSEYLDVTRVFLKELLAEFDDDE